MLFSRSELDTSMKDTETELLRSSAAVKAYESVGVEFEQVVNEFTHLVAEVANRRWAVHELKKHSTTMTADERRVAPSGDINTHSFLT